MGIVRLLLCDTADITKLAMSYFVKPFDQANYANTRPLRKNAILKGDSYCIYYAGNHCGAHGTVSLREAFRCGFQSHYGGHLPTGILTL